MKDYFGYLAYKYENNQIGTSNDAYPFHWEIHIQEAVRLKRNAKYEDACKIYFDLMNNISIIFAKVLYFMYKPTICSGDIFQAAQILLMAKDIYNKDPNYEAAKLGIPSIQESTFFELLSYIRERDYSGMLNHMKEMSGNENYVCPVDLKSTIENLLNIT